MALSSMIARTIVRAGAGSAPGDVGKQKMSVNAATSERAAETAPKPYSAALIGDLLRLLDVALILLLGLAIYLLYVYPEEPQTGSQYLVTVLVATIMSGMILHWLGVYWDGFLFTRGLRIDRMLVALVVAFALLLSVAFALKISDFYSRVWLVTWFVSSAVLLSIARLCFGHCIARLARRGRFANRTVIVGTGPQADKLASHLAEYDSVLTRVLGFIEPDREAGRSRPRGTLILGGLDALIRMVRCGQVDQIFIALPWNDAESLRRVTHRLAMTPVAIRLAPDLAGFEFSGRSFAEVAGLPMLPLFDRPISGWSRLLKVAEDKVLAVVFLVLLAPLLMLTALAVKLSSHGPALFKQQRYGFNDQLIEIWKFRTMYHHLADPNADKLATKDDARVTPVGRFLRRMSLDELPQLFNVLRGEMSLVGPRPHAMAAKAGGQLYDDVVDRYAARHRVKPGITGWAQVNGWRGETDTFDKIQKRVEHDLYYIDNWSVWLDFRIIAKTVMVLFKGEKAY